MAQGSARWLPDDWQPQIIRAYETFGVIDNLIDALTPDMRSILAKRRRRDTREGREGEFLEERNTFLPEPEVRADLDDIEIRNFFATVRAEQQEWAKKGAPNREDSMEEFERKTLSARSKGDFYTAIMLQHLGASEPPLVLSPAEFDQYDGEPVDVGSYNSSRSSKRRSDGKLVTEEEDTFWRGIQMGWRTQQKTAAEIVEETAYSPAEDYYIGDGIFGNGTYIGSQEAAEQSAGGLRQSKAGTQLLGENGNVGAMIRFKLKPGTRLIDWSDIPQQIQGIARDDLAAWVILNGYHGINATKENDWYGGINILDRSQLVMERLLAPGEVYEKTPTPGEKILKAMEYGDDEEALEIIAQFPYSPMRELAEDAIRNFDYQLLKKILKQLERQGI